MAELPNKRTMLNTTVNKDVLETFKSYCKSVNCPMNTVLEAFMKQFSQGQFELRIGKGQIQLDIE